jgi:hypothetical protein
MEQTHKDLNVTYKSAGVCSIWDSTKTNGIALIVVLFWTNITKPTHLTGTMIDNIFMSTKRKPNIYTNNISIIVIVGCHTSITKNK